MRQLNAHWGYRINYDREISQDQEDISQTERHVALAAVLTDAERAWGPFHLTVLHFLFANVEQRAPLLGLSEDDVVDLWWWSDMVHYEQKIDVPEPKSGWYSRGEAIERRLRDQLGEYVIRDPQPMVKKLRTRLARHRRNKVKFG